MPFHRALRMIIVGAVLVTLGVASPVRADSNDAAVSATHSRSPRATQPSPPRGPLGWQRYRYTTFTDAAGAACQFRVRGEIVRQDVWFRTSDTYPDGAPKDQLFIGPLYVRYVNESNGKSIVASLSGSASIHYDPDGTQLWNAVGPFGVTIHPGNPYHRAGEFVIGGVTELELHRGLVPQIRFHRGPMLDVCAALR